jgi:hypothetical protein
MATILRVRTVLSGWQGGPGLLTYYFRPNQTTLTADALAATARVRGALDIFKTSLPLAASVQVSGTCDVLDEATGALVTGVTVADPAVVLGTAAGGFGPVQVMGGLILDTSSVVGGRKLRARSFLGPLAVGFTASPAPSAPLLTNVAAVGVALVTVTPPAASTPLVAWQRPRKARTLPTPLPARPGVAVPVLSSRAAVKFFTLRSRLN